MHRDNERSDVFMNEASRCVLPADCVLEPRSKPAKSQKHNWLTLKVFCVDVDDEFDSNDTIFMQNMA
jgi:hypothetical protein